MNAELSPSAIRVAIVEDNPDDRELFRRGVAKAKNLACVGTYVTGEEAVVRGDDGRRAPDRIGHDAASDAIGDESAKAAAAGASGAVEPGD